MYTVKIIFNPKAPQVAEFQLQGQLKKVENTLIGLGYKIRDNMRATISANSQRKSTGNLARAVETEINQLPNGLSVGVGNVDTLNNQAEYWYVVNYGKKYDDTVFIPGGNTKTRPLPVHTVGGGVVFRTSKAGVGFQPIQPMNFIESTLNWLSGQLSTLSVR